MPLPLSQTKTKLKDALVENTIASLCVRRYIQRRRTHHANNFHTSPQMQTAPPSPNLRPTPSLNRPTTNRRQHQNVSNLSHLPISHLWLGTPYWIMVAWGPALNVMAILLTWKTASCGTLRDLVDNVLNVPLKHITSNNLLTSTIRKEWPH